MCCMLRRFLGGEVLPWFENRRKELTNRPLIREQALGEALDPDKLERLGRYDGGTMRPLLGRRCNTQEALDAES